MRLFTVSVIPTRGRWLSVFFSWLIKGHRWRVSNSQRSHVLFWITLWNITCSKTRWKPLITCYFGLFVCFIALFLSLHFLWILLYIIWTGFRGTRLYQTSSHVKQKGDSQSQDIPCRFNVNVVHWPQYSHSHLNHLGLTNFHIRAEICLVRETENHERIAITKPAAVRDPRIWKTSICGIIYISVRS